MAPLLIVGLLACTSAVYAVLNENDKVNIVQFHNDLRSKVALGQYVVNGRVMPAATNMRKLTWSNAIAAQTQAYADNCVYAHSDMYDFGENLYMKYSTDPVTLEDNEGVLASGAWADELQTFNWQSVLFDEATAYSGMAHATQMIWAETDTIGCGASHCNGNTRVILVCQYTPLGDIITLNIYEPGAACSNCTVGTTCEPHTGLCV